MLAPPPLPRKLEAAFRDLSSARGAVRASAIEDLVRHARGASHVREQAIPLLEKRLFDDEAAVRSAAAVALGDLGANDAVPSLIRAIEDADPHVRQMALNALGEIADDRASRHLEKALSDRRPEVRYQAIIAYCRVATDDASIARALLDATNDEDVAIVHIALRLAEERLDARRDAGADVRAQGEGWLATRARALLKSPSPHVALVAAMLLGKLGDPAGHALILKAVRRQPIGGGLADKEEERAAVELAGELGIREAIPDLERRVWGLSRLVRDTCRFHALIGLLHVEHPRAREEVLRDLDATRNDVRAAAVVAAGRGRLVEARAKLQALSAESVDPELVREALARLEAASR